MRRRDFLQTLGVGSASIAAFSCGDQAEARRTREQMDLLSDADLEWKKAPCRYCGTGCGVEVGIAEGRAVAVRGDEANPVNRGMLCVKGYHLPAMLYGEDRLRYPMLRNQDGRGWSRVSWDEAYTAIADEILDAIRESGPHSIIYEVGPGNGGWLNLIPINLQSRQKRRRSLLDRLYYAGVSRYIKGQGSGCERVSPLGAEPVQIEEQMVHHAVADYGHIDDTFGR